MTVRAPDWLPVSARTDLRQLRFGVRPTIRLVAGHRVPDLRRWARRNGYFAAGDRDGYVVLSRQPSLARIALRVDRRPGRHTIALGLLLGYPPCCSRAAARVGDEGIDHWHTAIAGGRFIGLYKLTNPYGYTFGSALNSHVPCSRRCAASLLMALRTTSCTRL